MNYNRGKNVAGMIKKKVAKDLRNRKKIPIDVESAIIKTRTCSLGLPVGQ